MQMTKFRTSAVCSCPDHRPIPPFGFVSDFAFGICSVIFPLVCLSGCATFVTPPAHPADPVTVYLTDYGRHSSLLLPSVRQSGYDEWAFGDWEFFAKGDTRWWVAMRAVLYSPQSTLSWRYVAPQSLSSDAKMQSDLKCKRLMRLQAPRCRVEALAADLYARFHRDSSTPVYSSYSSMWHVPDYEHYWGLHNCNHVTAAWLRRLDCKPCGPAIWSNFKLNPPVKKQEHSFEQ